MYGAGQCGWQSWGGWRRGADQQWVDCWALSKGQREVPIVKQRGNENGFKIGDLSRVVKQAHLVLSELGKVKADLQNAVDCDEWDGLWSQVVVKKAEADELVGQIAALSSDDIARLKQDVERRIRKRQRDGRRKKRANEERTEELQLRQRKASEVDKWMESVAAKSNKAKQEHAMKLEADSVLGDVRRKQSEARRSIALLSALAELRKEKVRPGEDPRMQQEFESRLQPLKDMMSCQLELYEKEEAALRVIMDQDNKDAKRPKRKESAVTDLTSLFGPPSPNHTHPLYPHYLCQTAAQRDLAALTHVRNSWDQYLDSSGQSVPPTWVAPPDIPTEGWEVYLQ